MALEFTGKGAALSSNGLAGVAKDLDVKAPEIWAVLGVETSGCGFLVNQRPPILYERHIFSRLTHGVFDDGNISDPSPGGYGKGGVAQYDRLDRAIALDRNAALQSASWGIGQILGSNFGLAGFTSVENMVAAMCDAEDNQLTAFAKFLKSSKLDKSLQVHDWTAFARGYNGPNFAQNHYDVQLRGEFQKFSLGALPDLRVRACQIYLNFKGFSPGHVDGVAGVLTRDALRLFQKAQGLPITGLPDDATFAALTP